MSEFVLPADVRGYLNITSTSGPYSDGMLSSNIRAASAFLERQTSRQFAAQAGVTKTFTTHGQAQVAIPDLRTATAVVLQDTTLTADETFWLIEDVRHSGVYVAIQLHNFNRSDYRANPGWFDRNLDRDWRKGWSSLPNDLDITGDWGHDPLPDELLHATKVLAAWYTKRPDSVLAGVAVTAEGTELRYSDLPPEVAAFITAWNAAEQMVAI